MPNIEIHSVFREDRELRWEIFDYLKKFPELIDDLNEVVVCFVGDDPRDEKGDSQPYLRLLDSNPERLEYLAVALGGAFDLDVEKILIKFLPRPPGDRELNHPCPSCGLQMRRSGPRFKCYYYACIRKILPTA